MGKRGPQPKRHEPIPWTPELAYVVGLITTDGCLSNDGRHLDITSKDTQLLTIPIGIHDGIRVLRFISSSSQQVGVISNGYRTLLQQFFP